MSVYYRAIKTDHNIKEVVDDNVTIGFVCRACYACGAMNDINIHLWYAKDWLSHKWINKVFYSRKQAREFLQGKRKATPPNRHAQENTNLVHVMGVFSE